MDAVEPARRTSRRSSLLRQPLRTATTFILLGVCVSSCAPSFDAAAPPDFTPAPSGDTGSPPDPVQPWVEECRQAASEVEFAGLVTYPRTLPVDMNEATTYQTVIDLSGSQLPPEEVIENPEGETSQRNIRVECIVGARLTPVGDDVTVSEDQDADGAGWVHRRFTSAGTVDWAWSVTAAAPDDQQVQLQLRPVLFVDDGARTIPADAVTTLVTRVDVQATRLDRLSYWFENEWKQLAAIAGVLGVSVLAVLTWVGKVRGHLRPHAGRNAGADSSA